MVWKTVKVREKSEKSQAIERWLIVGNPDPDQGLHSLPSHLHLLDTYLIEL